MQTKSLFAAATTAALTVGFAAAQEDCATAMPVVAGVATAFDTTTALPSAEPITCVSGASNDLWYTYTATGNINVTASLCGSTYDAAMAVYEGACGALVEVDCDDDGCGTAGGASVVSFIPVMGTTYTIRVLGWDVSSGAGTLTVTENTLPLNDECMDAIPVGEGLNGPYDNSLATASMGDPNVTTTSGWPCGGTTTPGLDLWFTYTPSFSGDFSITTCSPGTTFDTRIELFEGDCAMLTSMACNDDMAPACSPTEPFRSLLTYCGQAGTTYTFRVAGFNADTGSFELDITGAPGPDPNMCATTTFAGGNGLTGDGANYFDATFSQAAVVSALAVNSREAAGTPMTLELYTNPAGFAGNETDPSGWTLVGTAHGVSAGSLTPTWMALDEAIIFGPGTLGICVWATNYGIHYTNGNGANQTAASPDGVISLSLGTATGTLFSGGVFNPRVWNGSFCHDANIGTDYCPATNNSTGVPGVLIAGGSDCVSLDTLVLAGSNLPLNAFGYFLCSTTQGLSMPANSQGAICLAGDIGRAVGGAIYNSGSSGTMIANSTLTLPSPVGTGMVQVMVGDTWNYQLWTRDFVGGMATSNTTNATSVTYH